LKSVFKTHRNLPQKGFALTHLYLIDQARFSYDWTAGFPALAGQAFRVVEYRAAAAESAISESIFIKVDVPGNESNAEAAYLLNRGRSRQPHLRRHRRLLDEILSACSEDELARLNHRNAREIYHLTNCSSNMSDANS
jgi:predicted TIM-barrel fold metal-dependent hydrolase